jgi:hypothetical protein
MLGDGARAAAPVSVLQRYHVLDVLEVSVPGRASGVVYIVRDDLRRAEGRYVAADLTQGVIETESLKLSFHPKEFSNISAIQLKNQQGVLRSDILSDLHLKISTGILNKKIRVGAPAGG